MRFHLKAQSTAYIGVIVITLSCVSSMLLIFHSVSRARQSLRHVMEIELPITNATYEMEINAIETTNGVLAYLNTGQASLRDEVIKDSQEFNIANAEYERLAASPEHHNNAFSSATIFRESTILGQDLMALKDQQDSLIGTLILDLGRNSRMIRQVLEMNFGRSVELQKLAALRKTERDITAATASLAGYLATGQANHMENIVRISSQGCKTLAAFDKDKNPKVRRIAAEIDASLDMTIESAQDFMAQNSKLHQGTIKFLELRRQLDILFDKNIRAFSAKNLLLATHGTNRGMDSILLMIGIALPLSWLLSVFSALMMLKVTRRPIKALKGRTAELLEDGGLCKRISVRVGDEFCSLAEHFNLILDELESTLVSKDKLEQVNIELRKEIMERKAMQKALGKLSRKLIETQESERRHIARELHDHIGQSLTALKINMETQQANPAQEASYGLENLTIVIDMLTQVRNLSLDLRPPLLDDLGLVPALRWYLDQQAQRGDFTIEFVASAIEPRPSRDVENTCFRITQEALTNIIRYAQASHVRACLEMVDDENLLLLSIHDNGIGFDVAAAREGAMKGVSLGLLGMEERAQLIGGHIQFASAPGKGTEIRALLPLIIPEEVSE